jgi:hypothetical protein
VSERSKPDADKARQPSNAPKKVVAEWNRPSPMGSAVDRLIGQLVPELNPESEPSADGVETSEG